MHPHDTHELRAPKASHGAAAVVEPYGASVSDIEAAATSAERAAAWNRYFEEHAEEAAATHAEAAKLIRAGNPAAVVDLVAASAPSHGAAAAAGVRASTQA